MQITIIKEDNYISVDGVQKNVDLSFLPDDFKALQFNGTKGHVESSNIDNCIEFTAITSWSGWKTLDPLLKTASDVKGEVNTDENNEVSNPLTEDQVWEMFVWNRDSIISQSDWVVVRAQELGITIPDNIKAYRQNLRDLPQLVKEGKLPMPQWDGVDTIIFPWPEMPEL